jgi:wyosine [tRNA(Phe)-imidazoG37] synthetase (radical SAM superfamily)
LNDGEQCVAETAEFLARLKPAKSYLSVPTRPPADSRVKTPDEKTVTRAFRILGDRVHSVECLLGYEGDAFAFTGDPEEDLLSITAVHPMREEAVRAFLKKAGTDWEVVRKLMDRNELIEVNFENHRFYIRRLYTENQKR